MNSQNTSHYRAVTRELLMIANQEKRARATALKAKPAPWKAELESRIPPNVYTGLESAFCKGFSIVFCHGRWVIEKGFRKEAIEANFTARDSALREKGRRKELKLLRKSVKRADLLNLTVTTVEGIGLGALGIGMPDIVLFLATLLKGIYEAALNYGFEYESPQEQLLILKMMKTALSSGSDWLRGNDEVDKILELETVDATEADLNQEMKRTAAIFAMDMLLLKFIQGLPVVGILGGAANPIYYNKVLKYVQLKYRKRYLLKQRASLAKR